MELLSALPPVTVLFFLHLFMLTSAHIRSSTLRMLYNTPHAGQHSACWTTLRMLDNTPHVGQH